MKKTGHKTSRTILWILFFLGGIGFLIWAFFPRPFPVELAVAESGPYQQLVIEEGKTRAQDVFKILSPVDGNLKRIDLDPGDMVKKGDLLAEVEWPRPWPVNSPVDGRILRIHRESGGPIRRGDTIMEVADPGALEVVSEILTEDAIQIKTGASVRIESWGGCDPLSGKVRRIEPAAFTKVSALGIEEQRVNVIIDITSPDNQCEGLADGFRVHSHITTFETDKALTIPTGALFREGKEWAVFQVIEGRAKKTRVKISRRNPEKAMVESGLKAGDQVIVYPSDQVDEDSRVQAMHSS